MIVKLGSEEERKRKNRSPAVLVFFCPLFLASDLPIFANAPSEDKLDAQTNN
jgi:hypothetical protein